MTEAVVTPGPHGRSRKPEDQDSEDTRPKKRSEKDNAMETDEERDAEPETSQGTSEHHDKMEEGENDNPNKKEAPKTSARVDALNLIMQGNRRRQAMKKQSYTGAAQQPAEKTKAGDNGPTFPCCKFVHVTFTCRSGKKVLESLQEHMGTLLTAIKEEHQSVGLISSRMADKVITSAAMIPAKWARLNFYFKTQVDTKELTKYVTDRKPREISGTMKIGCGADLKAIIDRIAVDLTSEDVNVEIKELQVWDSERALAFMYSPDLPLQYVEEQVRNYIIPSAIQDLASTKTNIRGSLLTSTTYPTNVHLNYPVNYYTNTKRGEKPLYDARNKQMPVAETDATQRDVLEEALPYIKARSRERIGIKVVPTFIKPGGKDEERTTSAISIQKYRNGCDAHLAMKESTSYISLPGILRLDQPYNLTMKAEGDEAGGTVTRTVRELLMGATIENKRPLFTVVYESAGGTEAAFPNSRSRQPKTEMIAKCPAAYCMFNLLYNDNVTIASCVAFLDAMFAQTHVKLATANTQYDPDTDTVIFKVKLDELGLDEEERERKQIIQELEIDMSILDAENTTRPGAMENGIFYDHDDSNSMLSMNTNQYEERHPGLKDFNDLREEHEKEESEQGVTDDEKQGATARASGPPTAHSSSGAGTPASANEAHASSGEGSGGTEGAASSPGTG